VAQLIGFAGGIDAFFTSLAHTSTGISHDKAKIARHGLLFE
jgi:hypothetical protein